MEQNKHSTEPRIRDDKVMEDTRFNIIFYNHKGHLADFATAGDYSTARFIAEKKNGYETEEYEHSRITISQGTVLHAEWIEGKDFNQWSVLVRDVT